MRKIVCLGLIILAAIILLTGCTKKGEPQAEPEKNKVQTEQSEKKKPASNESVNNEANGGQEPHQFGGFEGAGQEFKGGNMVNDYNLSSVRRVPHPEFIRLVFEFTRGDSDEFGEVSPDYTVRLEKDSQSINIILNGVTKADIMKSKQQVISLSKLIKDIRFTPQEGSRGILSLELNNPVTFQVFDLGDPARVVVVLKPESGQADKL